MVEVDEKEIDWKQTLKRWCFYRGKWNNI
jgi:hypothetical protein